MRNRYFNYFVNLIFPAFVFGTVTGVFTSVIITLYKFCAKHVIELSEKGYHFIREHLYLIPVILAVMLGLAFVYQYIYKKIPNIKGGGIPTSIGVLRGVIRFRWIRNLIGTFFVSLLTFLIGVPLGNEGPSVQMGTSIGKGSVNHGLKKHRAWERYTMTGGACAGFSVATGASISGIMFSIEEAHQRISPMIFIVSATAVAVSRLTTEIISPILGVSITLFPELALMRLSAKDIWIPIALGLLIGLFAALFLRYYSLIADTLADKLERIPHAYKIFAVFALTLIAGLFSFSFISTGHHLILELIDGRVAVYMLLLMLFIRPTLTVFANSNSITGGIFLPIMAIGAVFSALIGKGALALGLGNEYYTIILVLGITACISAMMKMPLTAIFFAMEALSCAGNLLYVITVSTVAFMITEVFEAKSINDSVLENRLEKLNEGNSAKVIDTFVTVKEHSFAIGKQIRDIFWPANLFVLSVKRGEKHGAEVDEHGGKAIRAGDVLHVRYSTYDEERTREELTAIVGEQEYDEVEDKII
ncbi:MAG: chloride channel protein [Clostridia bacterium]|nr:chloride channel protein [Clostridia bacterium]